MQSARAAVAPGVPAYLVTRPTLGSRDVDRRALRARLARAVTGHRACVLLAPAGFGKTTALTAWAEQTDHPIAWLSLTAADHHPDHLARGLAAAIAGLEATAGRPPRVLVVDDIHLCGADAARAVLRPFLEHPPAGVHLLLSGRSDPGIGLPRLLAAGELALLAADDLAFTPEEVRLVGLALGRGLGARQAAALQELTGGWPVAVRLALLSASRTRPAIEPVPATAIPQLPEYLVESVIAELPDDLAGFVVDACVCDWLTSALANDLLDRTDSAEALEQVVAAGLPLERRESAGTAPVYRWHPLMASSGRTLLQRRDPARLAELERRAARALASLDPAEAAGHALRGGDPALASELLQAQWLAAVLRGDSALVEELCGQLPAPWSEHPETLAIRAACLRNAGEAERAAELDGRARRAVGHDVEPRLLDLTLSLARLFLIDDGAGLAAESDRARGLLSELPGVSGPVRACALLLVGWTELRLRHPRLALPLLREATQACRAEGLTDLAERARANAAFALAFAGDFAGATATVAAVGPDADAAGWRRADGAIEWFTLGWIRFWSGDAEGAIAAFQQAADQGGGLISYADLARCWLVDATVDAGNATRAMLSTTTLDLVPDQTIQGLPFDVYQAVARAGAALLCGDALAASRLLDRAITGDPQLPAANVLAAELYWRLGSFDRAAELAGLVLGDLPPYLRAGAVVVTALGAARDGRGDLAHERLEEALALAEPQGLIRPFLLRAPELADLLAAHPAWGTAHETMVTACLTRRAEATQASGVQPLTNREREILGNLSTTQSTTEIAAALHISPNTLKTHLKSIYRKLGVESRREAVTALRRAPAPDRRLG